MFSRLVLNFFRSEFFLTDYIYKYGNFDASSVKTSFGVEGYFDNFNMRAKDLNASSSIKKLRLGAGFHNTTEKTRRWEFVLAPNIGFLASPGPLMKNCELKLSFDRSNAYTSILDCGTGTPELKKPIEIKDCYAVTEYISSEPLRNYFDNIDFEPIRYHYDSCDVLIKSIPTGETEIRFDNLRGGELPLAMFAAVIPQSCLNGDKTKSSTLFQNYGVQEMNFTLNGNSVNGFPIAVKNQSPVFPMQKFLDTTDKYYNIYSSDFLNMLEFEYNFIWSHKFEAEAADQGWLGINFKLEAARSETMCLVVWIVSPTIIAQDKFHKIEKLNL